MFKPNRYHLGALLVVLLVLWVINGDIIKLFLGSVYVLFVPGFFITLAIFGKNKIDYIEQFILSIAFSITVVPITILILNIAFHMPINAIIIILTIAFISAIAFVVYYKREGMPKEIDKSKFIARKHKSRKLYEKV